MKNKPNQTDNQQNETDDGPRMEVTERGGVVTEITRDADGNILSVVKWVKRDKRDPRAGGPQANVEQPPL